MPDNPQAPDSLNFRNALTEFDHVVSDTVATGGGGPAPVVTLAVTTYKRPDLLVDAIRSALAQRFDRPFEIVVFDNDPASAGAAGLMEQLPELATRDFRYVVHAENMGVFGNFNRAILMARAPWLTILNDDDLLDDNYLALMFGEIDRDASIDGLVCLKRSFATQDRITDASAAPPASADERMNRGILAKLLRSSTGRRALARRVAGRALAEFAYRGRASRRIPAAKFFWGAVLGNGSGFIFRVSKAVEVGGFYPDEYPSSDIWFFARFAKVGHLRQHRVIAASIRQTEGNVTVSTITEQLAEGHRLFQAMAGSEVPRWYRRVIPLLIARDHAEYVRWWKTDISVAEVEKALGIRLPRDRPRLHAVLRVLMGGS